MSEMALSSSKPKLVHVLLGDVYRDSRVLNEVTYLSQYYDIVIFCLSPKQADTSDLPHCEVINPLTSGRSVTLFSYLIFFIKSALLSLRIKPSIVHGHDAISLPIIYFIKIVTGAKMIYDSHELWSQAHHKKRHKFIMSSAFWLERFIASKADHIITVSNSIAAYLSSYFGNSQISVIRNIPNPKKTKANPALTPQDIRRKLGVTCDTIIVLYQGMIRRERGVFVLADAIADLVKRNDAPLKLLYLGGGGDLDELKNYISECELEQYVLFHDAVSQDVLGHYSRATDIGVHAISNSCLNHDYCLPNKLFEYLYSGLPVVVTNLTEMKNFVEAGNFGLTFEDGNVGDLSLKIEWLLNKDRRAEVVSAIEAQQERFSYEAECVRLGTIYEGLLRQA